MRRWPAFLIGLLVLIVGGKFIYNALHHADDKALIQEALADAIKAGKEGRPGSVIDKLADNFKVNGQTADTQTIANFVKNNRPDVEISDTDPVISGDTAQITSDVIVKVPILGTPIRFKDAEIQFRKETAMDWFIFPTTKWELSAVRVNTDELPPLPMG